MSKLSIFDNQKKIIIEESDRKYFEQRNYIELINPYKEFICFGRDSNNKHIYKNFTKFSSLIELIKLDDSICDHLFPLLRNFEKKFRNILLLTICENYKKSSYQDDYSIAYVQDIKRCWIKKTMNL